VFQTLSNQILLTFYIHKMENQNPQSKRARRRRAAKQAPQVDLQKEEVVSASPVEETVEEAVVEAPVVETPLSTVEVAPPREPNAKFHKTIRPMKQRKAQQPNTIRRSLR